MNNQKNKSEIINESSKKYKKIKKVFQIKRSFKTQSVGDSNETLGNDSKKYEKSKNNDQQELSDEKINKTSKFQNSAMPTLH